MDSSEKAYINVHVNITPDDEYQGPDAILQKVREEMRRLGFDANNIIVTGFSGSREKLEKRLGAQGSKKKKLRGHVLSELPTDTDAMESDPLTEADQKGEENALLLYDGSALECKKDATGEDYYIAPGTRSVRDALVAIIRLTYFNESEALKWTHESELRQLREIKT